MKLEYENLSTVGLAVTTFATRLNKVTGFFNGSTATRWLQLHDLKAVPSGGGTIAPLRSWPLYVTAPFEQEFTNNPIELVNGCVLVVSITQTTFTTSADTMSLFVDGSSVFDSTGTTSAGDYTTGVASRTIWASGTPKNLLRLEVTKLTNPGGFAYLKLFAKSPAAGNRPFFQKVIANGDSFDGFFNTDLEQTVSNTMYNGCYAAIDATTGVYAGDYSGTDFAIKGTYK